LNALEAGFLLLTCRFGDPNRKVLNTVQMRTLADRIQHMSRPLEDRQLRETDLLALGYGREMASRIVSLLEEEDRLRYYCTRAAKSGCQPVTRVSSWYPVILRQRLGLDSPGCLWAKGELSLLDTPCIALVGSRELNPENRNFAEAVGRMAAKQGMTLVSGNARGADRAAQDACLENGGSVISIVADELERHSVRERTLFLSEDGFDEIFSAQRALHRNRCIHALGRTVFVAQANLHKGGTWDGTAKNLRFGWSNVLCFRDGSEAAAELENMGAYLVGLEDLEDFSGLNQPPMTLF